jgi:outer membrane receptor protein involved in Fe transport
MESQRYPLMPVRVAVAAVLATFMAGHAPEASPAESEVSGGADEELAEVTVTGSRIVRRDYEANSPLLSVETADLEQRSGLNIESYLNQLPAFNPAASPNVRGTNSDFQITAVNTTGISSVSLRGFGANRSLVLIDNRRAVPINPLMVVDVNGIPSSMIERVEIISGGASATYGADAIGGVSNFLLRRNFRGLELNGSYGLAEAGDNDETRASAIVGTSIGDGRGSIVFAGEYYDRKAAYERNRDFFRKGMADPTVGGNSVFLQGVNGYNFAPPAGAQIVPGVNPASNYYPAVSTLAALFGRSGTPGPTKGVVAYPGPTGGAAGVTGTVRFNPDASLFTIVGDNAASWRGPAIDNFRYGYADAYNNALCNSTNLTSCPNGPQAIQQVKYNMTEYYAQSPQTRYAFMGSANYGITDDLNFTASGRFAQSDTSTVQSAPVGTYGRAASIPYNPTTDSPVDPTLDYRNAAVVAAVMANPAAYANPGFIAHGAAGAQHPVPVPMAMLLNSRTNRNAAWVVETYPVNSVELRGTTNTSTVWQVDAGLNWRMPFKDWTSELYYSRGETSSYGVVHGINSLLRWRTLVSAADYGRNSHLQSNTTPPNVGESPGFGTMPVPCTSGFYETIFNGDAKPSDDCVYAVAAPLQSRTEVQQDIGELNLQGGLFELPAGEVRAAAGYQYRRTAAQYSPDILQSTAEFTDSALGLYPAGYMDSTTKARDVYGELLVPVLKDFGVRKFELELGGRHSDYDLTDSTFTYKMLGNLEINDFVRLRGGYNRATRAPNLGEMFLPLQQTRLGDSTYGDPCGVASNSPFGAGGAIPNPVPGQPSAVAGGQTAAGAQSTYLICRAQMGTAGADQFYTSPQPATGNLSLLIIQEGNANLKSEKADTWTVGAVLRSPFEHALLRNMTASVDWYSIKINDAILPYTVDYAGYLCYGTVQVASAAEAAAQAATKACQNLPRDQVSGAISTAQVSYDNQATVRTSGIDFTFNWAAQLADMGLSSLPGSLGLNITGSVLDYYRTKQSPASFDPVIDWKGSLGPSLTSFDAGAYDYRLFTSLSYTLPTYGVSLRWRHLPSVAGANAAREKAIIANNAAVAAGGEGIILSYAPITNLDVGAYDVFDLSGFWSINDVLSLRFGIDNVFDREPETTGRTLGRPYDSSKTPAENAAVMAAVCGGMPGCVTPTSYTLGSSGLGTTNGGFYDTLGRRYYIGLKARF